MALYAVVANFGAGQGAVQVVFVAGFAIPEGTHGFCIGKAGHDLGEAVVEVVEVAVAELVGLSFLVKHGVDFAAELASPTQLDLSFFRTIVYTRVSRRHRNNGTGQIRRTSGSAMFLLGLEETEGR